MRGILHHAERIIPNRRAREPWQSGSDGNWKHSSSLEDNLLRVRLMAQRGPQLRPQASDEEAQMANEPSSITYEAHL
jgi:hypothetical protein